MRDQKQGRRPVQPDTSRLLLGRFLSSALEVGGTVLHIEPDRDGAKLRIRSGLELRQFHTLTREEYGEIWQNLADRVGNEELTPFYDGSFPFGINGRHCRIRVSLVPTPFGESVTLKVNAREDKVLGLERLGLSPTSLVQLRNLLARNRGLLVVAAPPGSGGTTTWVSIMESLCDGTRKVVSIEDPIEVSLEGVQQIQIKSVRDCPDRSVTFERALRSVLLQDPDVLGISLLKDLSSGHAALSGALVGSLTVTRVHAYSATLALGRLLQLGIESTLLSDCLAAVLAQSLVRKNCPACSQPDPNRNLEGLKGKSSRGKGCEQCHGTGFSGLVAVFELLINSTPIAKLIEDRRSGREIEGQARIEGMTPRASVVRTMVESGEVPLTEYLRIL